MLARVSSIFFALALAIGIAASPAGVVAQGLPNLLPAPSPGAIPSDVVQQGLYMTAPVLVDNVPVFRIAVAGTDTNAALAVEARAQAIDATIAQILTVNKEQRTTYDPNTLEVTVVDVKDHALIKIRDDDHGPTPLLTVTSADAKARKQTVMTLATQWQGKLQSALVSALQKRQPAEVKQNYNVLTRVVIVLIVATAFVWLFCVWLGRKIGALEERVDSDDREMDEAQSRGAAGSTDVSTWRQRLTSMAVRAVEPQQRLRALLSMRAVAVLLLVLAWLVAATWALFLFPQTTFIGYSIARHVTRIGILWILALLLVRFADIIIERVANLSIRETKRSDDDRPRRLLRIPTISRALEGLVSFLVIFTAILLTLSQLGISTTSVLTISGLVALGASLAAQNLIRDFLYGFLVLFEDQYVVGDYVTIGTTSGLVERMTLRIVQIRDGDGNLVTIPYSLAMQVVNGSRNWSRVDYSVAVAPDTDIAKALKILRDTTTAVAKEDKWRSAVIDPAEIVGVTSMWREGIVLRVSMKVAPLQQFALRRELNERVLAAFSSAGIQLGVVPGNPVIAPPAL